MSHYLERKQLAVTTEPPSEMDSLSCYQHLELNPPPSPSPGQGFSCYCPPFATADGFHIAAAHIVTDRDKPTLPVRPARKDRHSKICTAGGMRDRRLRLSLDVARRFFALQDKLGFDKASKTVQWLLDMSTPGINDLITTSMSEPEDGSVLLGNHQIMMADSAETTKQRPKASNSLKQRAAPATPRKSNAAAPVHVLPDKESRARARERARERTRERNRLRSIEDPASSQAVPGCCSFEHGGYYEQEPWELSGVVFAKPRFH